MIKRTLAAFAVAAGLLLGQSVNAQLFKAGELSLMGFGTYVDKQDNHWGAGAGIGYFLTENIGVAATTHWEDVEGTFFDNIFGEAYLRLPLRNLPVAPYALGTAGYSWEYERWVFGAGGGAELRLNETVGIFSDIQWLFNEGADNDGVKVRFGFRFNM